MAVEIYFLIEVGYSEGKREVLLFLHCCRHTGSGDAAVIYVLCVAQNDDSKPLALFFPFLLKTNWKRRTCKDI